MKRARRNAGAAGGFTLVELLVVIAIIGVLVGLLSVALKFAKENAKETRYRSDVRTLESAITAYRHEYGNWPGLAPGASSESYTFKNNNYKVLSWLTEDASTEIDVTVNPREVRFITVSDYRWGESNVYTGTVPALNPDGDPYEIEIQLDDDAVYVR